MRKKESGGMVRIDPTVLWVSQMRGENLVGKERGEKRGGKVSRYQKKKNA